MFKRIVIQHRVLAIAMSFVLLLIRGETLAQSDFPSISVKMGIIRNLQDERFHRDKSKYSFYPEVQIGGSLVYSTDSAVSLDGGLYFGYWDDGVSEASSSCVDCLTYSYNSRIVGARLGLIFEKFTILPIGIAFGLARHFINAEYVGGTGFAGNIGQDFERGSNTAEVVLFTVIPLNPRMLFTGEVQQFVPLGNNNSAVISPYKRRALKIGFKLSL